MEDNQNTSLYFYNSINEMLCNLNTSLKNRLFMGEKRSFYNPKIYCCVEEYGVVYNAILQLCNSNKYIHIPCVLNVFPNHRLDNFTVCKNVYENHDYTMPILSESKIIEWLKNCVDEMNVPTETDRAFEYPVLFDCGVDVIYRNYRSQFNGYYIQGSEMTPEIIKNYTKCYNRYLPKFLIDDIYHNESTECFKNNFVFIAKGNERMLEHIYEPFDVKDFDNSIRMVIWQKEISNTAVDKYIRGDITKDEFEQLLEYNPDDNKDNIDTLIKEIYDNDYTTSGVKPNLSEDYLSVTKDLPDDVLKELNWGIY